MNRVYKLNRSLLHCDLPDISENSNLRKKTREFSYCRENYAEAMQGA